MKGLSGVSLFRQKEVICLQSSDFLFESAKTGNADSFALLYEKYANQLYLYAYKYLENREDAEDAVSQASINVYKNIKNIKKGSSFKAYYFKALSNSCRDILKKRKFTVLTADEAEGSTDSDITETSVIEKSMLDSALASLSDSEREIVLLSAVSGFTSAEISKITGLTGGSVRSKLSRSLAKLRTLLEKENQN